MGQAAGSKTAQTPPVQKLSTQLQMRQALRLRIFLSEQRDFCGLLLHFLLQLCDAPVLLILLDRCERSSCEALALATGAKFEARATPLGGCRHSALPTSDWRMGRVALRARAARRTPSSRRILDGVLAYLVGNRFFILDLGWTWVRTWQKVAEGIE